jgi:hypothetical protein
LIASNPAIERHFIGGLLFLVLRRKVGFANPLAQQLRGTALDE